MMIALTPRIPICRTAQYFNPHFREGSDGQEYTVKGILMLFQSTLPQGKWPTTIKPDHPPRRFQSTLPQGKWPLPFLFCTGKSWFQSTLPQGKWLTPLVTALVPIVFQSTLPQGKWRGGSRKGKSWCNFNPHFRKGSDVDRMDMPEALGNFNPHFRKGSDGISIYANALDEVFQSTLPQGKWPGAWRHGRAERISIHTSAREVTKDSAISTEEFKFQSTLPQGKWRYDMDELESQLLFQSTLPQGKWHNHPSGHLEPSKISIHTSAREVTYPDRNVLLRVLRHFNPHFRKGSDIDSSTVFECTCYFNPHFRKGSDCNISQKHLSIFMKYL